MLISDAFTSFPDSYPRAVYEYAYHKATLLSYDSLTEVHRTKANTSIEVLHAFLVGHLGVTELS